MERENFIVKQLTDHEHEVNEKFERQTVMSIYFCVVIMYIYNLMMDTTINVALKYFYSLYSLV